jgi:hypothetical protein
MSRTLTAVKFGALALALGATSLSAQETRMRLPSNGAAEPANRAAATVISARPYAGSWTGTFSLAAAPREIPMSVQLSAVEGSFDTYAGQTQVARSEAFTNAPISTLAMALPRSAGEGTQSAATMASPAGPPRTIAALDLSSGKATLAARGARQLMCDPNGLCADVPVAKWESKGLNGASWIYTAKLVGADKIEGTISVNENGTENQIATFSLAKQN